MLYVRTTGNTDGDPLLCLHGFSGHGGDLAPFEAALGARFRLVIPDLRGHGRSPNDLDAFTHAQCATDVLELVDHLGIAGCRALGISTGGNTLLHMTTRQPSCVSAMVIVGATTRFPERARRLMALFTAENLPEAEWKRLRASHPGGDAQIRTLLRHGQALKDATDMDFTAETLARIEARTLIVYGDRDPFYPVEIALEMYRAIPKAALCVLPSAGHAPIFTPPYLAPFLDMTLSFLYPAAPLG